MKLIGRRGIRTVENKPARGKSDYRRVNRDKKIKRRNNRIKINFGRKVWLSVILLILILSAAGFGVWYSMRDTTRPSTYILQPVFTLEGRSVSPTDFLSSADLQKGITVKYADPEHIPGAGRHSIPLTVSISDETFDEFAYLYVLTPIESVRAEFGVATQDLRPEKFIVNAGIVPDNLHYDLRFTTKPMPLHEYPVGEFTLFLSLNDIEFEVMLYVEDTTAPTVSTVEVSVPKGDEVTPSDFISSISDASPIASVVFISEPDTMTIGTQTVEIAVEDTFGNRMIRIAVLSILPNDIPPEIAGARDIDSMPGRSITYLQGVNAYDTFGRPLEIEVDSSDVNPDQRGTYNVFYRTEDIYGLVSEVGISVHIINTDTDLVDERIDAIFAEIMSDDMTQVEQARAIYTWIKENITFISTAAEPDSSYEGAYRALEDRRGGFIIFSSLSDVMLFRVGIPAMFIERIPEAPTKHRWNLVNPDRLGWYHFDAFPIQFEGSVNAQYMFNDSHAEDFTLLFEALGGDKMYYIYDPSLYPKIAYE